MNKKAFTLIELLAVIVILGIIAVIVVPKAKEELEKSKKNVAQISAQNYIKETNKYLLNEELNKNNIKLNGKYQINGNGYLYNNTNTYEISFDGQKPKNGYLYYNNNEFQAGCITFNKYAIVFKKGEISDTTKDTCENIHINIIPDIVTSGDGLYESTTDEGRLIYRGENPNNYINIKEDGTNNTLYRIVSYETDGTIKIVRDEKLSTNMAWDEANVRNNTNNTLCASSYGCNAWGNGSNTLYNEEALGNNFHYIYYSSASATTMSNGASGKVTSDSTLNTYLNDTWLPSSLTNYIDNHSWNVGGVYYYFGMSDKGIIKEKEEEKQLKWVGKVGLLNITEYAEASINQSCTSARSNYDYTSGSPCKTDNWILYNKDYSQWSLSPHSSTNSNVWTVTPTGYFFNYISNMTTISVRPVFYLKSTVGIEGEGTEINPYYIVD